jgi:rubrerythrin
MHYCRICGVEFKGFKDTVRHVLTTHRDKLDEWEIETYQRWLSKAWTCNDCEYAGEIVASYDESEPLKKYCPPEYLFNHPNPAEECPNFIPKEYLNLISRVR